LGEESNRIFNNRLLGAMQLINLFIGVIIALICVVAYITIESIYIRGIIIVAAVSFGVVCFVDLYKRLHRQEVIQDESHINSIELVNEDNEIIRNWTIGERISFLIGKNGMDNDVFIDLTSSIYSNLIENNHAVLNYAAGKWYIEDLSSDKSGVSIQKADDNQKYRIVKNTPCELKRGDIIFISKVKLLLK